MRESKHRKRFDLAVGIIGILGFGVGVASLVITAGQIKPQVDDIQKQIDTITIIQKDTRIIRDTVFLPLEGIFAPIPHESAHGKLLDEEKRAYYESLKRQKETFLLKYGV